LALDAGKYRAGVGPTDILECQMDPLKTHPIFALSRNFTPVIFHFKKFPEKIRRSFLSRETEYRIPH
jgi:hypothetical protein